MEDLINILEIARNKKVFQNNEFEELLKRIQLADSNLKLDWDDGAGEEWATFSNQRDGLVCMINARIGVAFIKRKYEFHNIESVINTLEIVYIDDYSSNNWSVDLNELKQKVPEIIWHSSEEAVNSNRFSLYDLYFATV